MIFITNMVLSLIVAIFVKNRPIVANESIG